MPCVVPATTGDGEVVSFTLGHCRSHWDMIDPPHNGARWPTVERGSWHVPEFMEILRRGRDLGEGFGGSTGTYPALTLGGPVVMTVPSG